MNRNVVLDEQIEVSQIFVEPGEAVTVWLCSQSSDGFPRKQVELRVTSGGKQQIFTNGDIDLRRFSTWRADE